MVLRNTIRLKKFAQDMIDIGCYFYSCLYWESYSRSLIAFIIFLLFVYYFEFYMVPLVLLLYLIKNYFQINFYEYCSSIPSNVCPKESTELTEVENVGPKKTIRSRFQAVQEISSLSLITIDQIASYIERFKK